MLIETLLCAYSTASSVLVAISGGSSSLTGEICQLARKLLFGYDRKIDLELEKKVIELYDISREEVLMIMEEINKLPNLSAINNMKFTEEELEQCIDI